PFKKKPQVWAWGRNLYPNWRICDKGGGDGCDGVAASRYLRPFGAVAAFTLASVKLAAWRAALVNESNAAVAAASEDFIAATATSLPAGAPLAACSTASVTARCISARRSSASFASSAWASEATS